MNSVQFDCVESLAGNNNYYSITDISTLIA